MNQSKIQNENDIGNIITEKGLKWLKSKQTFFPFYLNNKQSQELVLDFISLPPQVEDNKKKVMKLFFGPGTGKSFFFYNLVLINDDLIMFRTTSKIVDSTISNPNIFRNNVLFKKILTHLQMKIDKKEKKIFDLDKIINLEIKKSEIDNLSEVVELNSFLKEEKKHLIIFIDEYKPNSCEQLIDLIKSIPDCLNIHFAFAGTTYNGYISGLSDFDDNFCKIILDLIYKKKDFDFIFKFFFFFIFLFFLI
jgi:hypothetical protein